MNNSNFENTAQYPGDVIDSAKRNLNEILSNHRAELEQTPHTNPPEEWLVPVKKHFRDYFGSMGLLGDFELQILQIFLY